ncbi:MAG: hypothetical protein ACPGU9_09295 [Flavobacteriaceae bacterium]
MALNNNIDRLLEKYVEANTTIAEEQELQRYFSSSNVAPHLEDYKALFQYFSQAKNETTDVTVALKPKTNFLKWSSIAASVILILGVFTFNSIQTQKEQEDALIAYYQTKEALQLISNQFNAGTTKINYLNTFETSKQQIFKSNH